MQLTTCMFSLHTVCRSYTKLMEKQLNFEKIAMHKM